MADGVHDEVENENDFRVQPLGICVKVLKLKNQDEKCEASIECKWGFCVDGKCKAVEDGGTCTSEKDCSSISYCKLPTGSTIGVCAALVAAGGDCKDTKDCTWGSVCSNDKCVEMYSLADGELASDGKACQGGETKVSETKNAEVCASHSYNADTSCKKEGSRAPFCYYKLSTGISGDSDELESPYDCAQDKDGNYVCPLVESSEEFKNYLTVYRETLADLDDEEKSKLVKRTYVG